MGCIVPVVPSASSFFCFCMRLLCACACVRAAHVPQIFLRYSHTHTSTIPPVFFLTLVPFSGVFSFSLGFFLYFGLHIGRGRGSVRVPMCACGVAVLVRANTWAGAAGMRDAERTGWETCGARVRASSVWWVLPYFVTKRSGWFGPRLCQLETVAPLVPVCVRCLLCAGFALADRGASSFFCSVVWAGGGAGFA